MDSVESLVPGLPIRGLDLDDRGLVQLLDKQSRYRRAVIVQDGVVDLSVSLAVQRVFKQTIHILEQDARHLVIDFVYNPHSLLGVV